MNGKFDTVDCEAMWKNVLNPSINKKKWSQEEESELEDLVDKYNMKNWKKVAEELGVCRL